jgi:predicted AlkP superfamily pyrophosphatase or phosphodiesterase
MQNKVILISIDGMRSDGLRACGNPYTGKLEEMCTYTYTGGSMNPSVTFPCHFSMTHSVTPQRHGILTNTYVPQVRPVMGIFEKIKNAGGISAMFYGWEPLRDIASPGALKFSTYINAYMKESSDTALTDEAISVISENKPDFAFLYMVETDEKGGHDNGWMSEEYLRRVSIALDNVKRVVERFGEEYTVIITADHGGHDRGHGSERPEDMVIPMFFRGKDFTAGPLAENCSLLDIAPTITAVLGITPVKEWGGHALCNG